MKIIKNMKDGEITSPIIKPNSILFLKLNDKKKSKVQKLNKMSLKKIN